MQYGYIHTHVMRYHRDNLLREAEHARLCRLAASARPEASIRSFAVDQVLKRLANSLDKRFHMAMAGAVKTR